MKNPGRERRPLHFRFELPCPGTAELFPFGNRSRFPLLTDTELVDDSAVTLDVLLLEVSEKISSVTDHLEKTAAAVVILRVDLQVLGERVDAVGEDRDLDLRRAGILLVDLVLCDDLLFYVLLNHGFTPQKK